MLSRAHRHAHTGLLFPTLPDRQRHGDLSARWTLFAESGWGDRETKHIIKRAWAQHAGRKKELGRERNPAKQKRQGQEDRHTRREAVQNQGGPFTE